MKAAGAFNGLPRELPHNMSPDIAGNHNRKEPQAAHHAALTAPSRERWLEEPHVETSGHNESGRYGTEQSMRFKSILANGRRIEWPTTTKATQYYRPILSSHTIDRDRWRFAPRSLYSRL